MESSKHENVIDLKNRDLVEKMARDQRRADMLTQKMVVILKDLLTSLRPPKPVQS